MSERLAIESHKGPYEVVFEDDALGRLTGDLAANAHLIVDDRVAALYEAEFGPLLDEPSVLRIEAREESKSLDRFPSYVEHLVGRGVRRDHTLIAIGGGITQDITCFLAATLLRGVAWHFYPTTLLAQADSCIGSKSSINCGAAKNILGTFTPPERIVIGARFLDTLDERDVRSGVGEMLKAHAIEGPGAFDRIAADYERLFKDRTVMVDYIHRSLAIKKRYIEEDEFDLGPRNVFNYGHSFGHAIEAATGFAVPHGIAVTIGMDMANFAALRFGIATDENFRRMHPTLKSNYQGFENHPIPTGPFLDAIAKDKKNTGSGTVALILPDAEGRLSKGSFANDDAFAALCADYLEREHAL